MNSLLSFCPVARLASLLVLLSLGNHSLSAERIHWYCDVNSLNYLSTGDTLAENFVFELGVFRDGFVPQLDNRDEWSEHWVAADRVPYSPDNHWFASVVTVKSNTEPFARGTPAYIWGFGGDGVKGEWILLRRENWKWPRPSANNPLFRHWRAIEADQVLAGWIGEEESFDLMSEPVEGVLPPVTTYNQWAEAHLDPDKRDPRMESMVPGQPNLLAFVYGQEPEGQSIRAMRSEIVQNSDGEQFLQLRIPRREDHVGTTMVIEISSDLEIWETWNVDDEVLEEVETGPRERVLRWREAIASENPRRFFRIRVSKTE